MASRAEVDTTNVRRTGELLSDRIAVISGSASPRGIGKATAELFAAHGARTVILDLDGEACEAVAAEIGGGSIGIGCDIRDQGACVEAVERVVGAFGRVDVLVNNAGVGSGTPILDITPEEFESRSRRQRARHPVSEPGGRPDHAVPGRGPDRVSRLGGRPAGWRPLREHPLRGLQGGGDWPRSGHGARAGLREYPRQRGLAEPHRDGRLSERFPRASRGVREGGAAPTFRNGPGRSPAQSCFLPRTLRATSPARSWT